jgi:hypothetical protein
MHKQKGEYWGAGEWQQKKQPYGRACQGGNEYSWDFRLSFVIDLVSLLALPTKDIVFRFIVA